MRLILFAFGLFILLGSCASDKSQEGEAEPPTLLEAIVKQVPDTGWVTKDHKTNEFHFDLSSYKIDSKKTRRLEGEWRTTLGQLEFLNTTLEPGDRVVFIDTVSKLGSGWGTITYNRAAKFYFTESGSHMYDYFIDNKGYLNMVHYEYRNGDLSFKTQPEPAFKQLTIDWINDNKIELKINNQKATLKR